MARRRATATPARLTGGELERPTRMVLAERVGALLKGEASRQVVKAHLAMVSDRYLAITGAERIAEHEHDVAFSRGDLPA